MNQYPNFEQGLHYSDLHEDHKNWVAELEFCKREISFFKDSLKDFLAPSSNPDKAALLEQMQNKLIVHDEQVDILLHEIKGQKNKLNDFIRSHEQNIEFITFSDHKEWREKVDTHRKLYNEMKQEFYQRIAKKINP